MKCPECKSAHTVKNGRATIWRKRKKSRVQQYRCNDCGRQFREGSKK